MPYYPSGYENDSGCLGIVLGLFTALVFIIIGAIFLMTEARMSP